MFKRMVSIMGLVSLLTALAPLAHAQDSDWTISGNDQYSAVSGYVGIGTTAPLTQLDVSSSTSALRLRAGSAATNFVKNQILFSFSGTPFYSHAIKSRHSSFTDDNALDFFVWDYLNDDKTDDGSLHVMTLSAENDGGVGVGTTTPSDRLHIYSDDGSDNVGYVVGNADRQWRVGVRGDTDDIFSIQDDTEGAMRLVIDDSGNVGVGTSIPSVELDVDGEIASTGDITSSGTICDSTGCIGSSSSSVWSTSGSDAYYSSGGVGIGTSSPSYLFHTTGTTGAGKNLMGMTDSTNSQTLAFGGSPNGLSVYNLSSSNLSFGTSNTERVTIDSSGNVGIGTSSPESTLDIVGDVNLGGYFAVVDPDAASDHADDSDEGSIAYYLDAFSSTGGTIYLQPGEYPIGSELVVHSDITIQGAGWNSIIEMNGSTDAMITKDGSGDGIDNLILKDFMLQGDEDVETSCIEIGGDYDDDPNTSLLISGLKVRDCGEHGVHVKGTKQLIIRDLILYDNGTDTSEHHNMYLRRIDNVTIENVISRNAAANGFSGVYMDGATINNYVARDNGLRGIRIAGSDRVTLTGVEAIDNGEIGILVQEDTDDDGNTTDSAYVTISGCMSHGNGDAGIRLDQGSHFIVNSCVIKGNSGYGVQGYSSPSDVIVTDNIFDSNSSGTYTGFSSSDVVDDNLT